MKHITDKEKYLIVFDLDGTLLSSKREILPSSIEAIKKLKDMGHIIAIASGRPCRSIKEIYQKLQLTGPYIAYNGMMYVLPEEQKKETLASFPISVIKDLIDYVGIENLNNYILENEDDLYFLKEDDEYLDFFFPRNIHVHFNEDIHSLSKDMMVAIIDLKDMSKAKSIENYVMYKYPDIRIRFWHDALNMGELFYPDTTKATTIRRLASTYDIPTSRIIAFGDGKNDLGMLQSVGISIAMKNGADELKEIATYITEEDNDHDGISKSLHQLFF